MKLSLGQMASTAQAAMEHPVQVLASTTEHIITASNTKLTTFDAA